MSEKSSQQSGYNPRRKRHVQNGREKVASNVYPGDDQAKQWLQNNDGFTMKTPDNGGATTVTWGVGTIY